MPMSSSAAMSRRRVMPKAVTLAWREVEVADRAEVGGVLGVRERIAPLDIVEPQRVEPGRDQELVLEREVDPLALAAVAQRGIVKEDACHELAVILDRTTGPAGWPGPFDGF